MATLKDEEEQKGQGTSQVLGQGMAQPAQPTGQAPQQAQSSAPAMIGSSATQTSAPVKNMPKQKAGTGSFANLKSYLQAAQGGGQQKVAQAATQQVQKLGAGAQKGLQQAQEAFKTRMEAGSLKGMETAAEEAKGIIGTATGTTYQAPQPAPVQEEPVDRRVGGPVTLPDPTQPTRVSAEEQYLKDNLGDRYQDFLNERRNLRTISSMDIIRDPRTGNTGPSITATVGLDDLYSKYGIDKTKIPTGFIETPNQPTPTQPAQAQQYFTPEQQQRFAEIINAQYGGPASLQQAGLYEQAAQSARAAQQTAQLTQTALGREQLLKDIFGRNRDYGRGASRLDALLLNASQQGVSDLQKQAEGAAKAQEALQAGQNLSANQAAQRAAAIEQVRSGARTAFTEGRGAEEQAVETRLKDVEDNWNALPDYLKQAIASKGSLTQQELDLLGIQSGTGFYNLTPDEIISTNNAERERLITKNELSRQLALQQLANLDESKQLQKDLLYTDLEKAGTQTIEDALNKKAIQDTLKAQENEFAKTAGGLDLTGYGMKKHKQTGNKYYAEETGNLKDILERAGYSFLPSTIPEEANLTGASTGEASTYSGEKSWTDPISSNESFLSKSISTVPEMILNPIASLAGLNELDVAGLFGGGGTLPSSYAKNTAKRLANKDLQRKVLSNLKDMGFYNRAMAGESEQTKAREEALKQILARQEKIRG
jgi:hypothetical protein